jgi:hypothetical protein
MVISFSCGGFWKAAFYVCASSSSFVSFLSHFPCSISFSCYSFYPLQIGRITLVQLYGGNLRNLIAVEFSDAAAYPFEVFLSAFDDNEGLPFVPDLSLPPVDGADVGYDVCASGQPFLHHSSAYRGGLLLGGSGDKNDDKPLYQCFLQSQRGFYEPCC